jgi:hypothetical protein
MAHRCRGLGLIRRGARGRCHGRRLGSIQIQFGRYLGSIQIHFGRYREDKVSRGVRGSLYIESVTSDDGAFGGLRSLLATRQFLQMNLGMLVVPEQFGLVHADQAFGATGALKDAAPQAGVARVVSAVLRVAKALKAAG